MAVAKRTSDETPAGALTGDELVRVVQGAGDVRTTTGAIAALAVAGGGGTSWFAITGKPTTLLGYGIVDAVSIAALNTALALKISVSASGTFGRTLLATGAASTARLALGLGTMALEETTSYYNKSEVDDLIDGVTVGGGGRSRSARSRICATSRRSRICRRCARKAAAKASSSIPKAISRPRSRPTPAACATSRRPMI
jgi:hypothetical protein